MKKLMLKTVDFESNLKMTAWETTFPAGHYMSGVGPLSKIKFLEKKYVPNPNMPDKQDAAVISEVVEIIYPEYLEGKVGDPVLVPATPDLVLFRCEIKEAITV